MDLSKAFDSVNHYLLLAKLNANGINHLDAHQLKRSYLSKGYQRVKVNNIFSDWKEIKFGRLQDLYFLMYLQMVPICLSDTLISVNMLTIQLSLHAIQFLKLLLDN